MSSDDETRQQKIAHLKRCLVDFQYFAKHHLKIRTKSAEIKPFILNKAQRYTLSKFEEQLSQTGKVRAVVLKGRQQGMSTLIEAWFYWQTSLRKNINAYILAHELTASDALFDMVDRYHRHNPTPPSVGASNAKELVFDRLASQYKVGTAGAKAGGRSQTSTLFHGSEVAFWPNAADHFAASVQTVPNEPGTVIVLESTANGASGEFYERWQDAVNGCDKDGNPVDYIAIFVPWFWQTEYAEPVDETFELRDDKGDDGVSEREYAELHGLTNEQMMWRRKKIAELRDPSKFRQEYPATPSEAFIASSEESFIKPHLVLRARKRADIEGFGPKIMGADPAGAGGDRFAVTLRQGSRVEWVEARNKVDSVEAAHWVRSLVIEHQPDKLYVDAGGIGHAIVSMLRSWPETAKVVSAVNFGSRSEAKTAKPKVPGPVYRRDEMWQRLGDWLALEEGVSLPDIDVLSSEMTSVKVIPQLNNDFKLESKKEMRKRGVRSPDLADAIALTFASLRYVPIDKPRPVSEKERTMAQKETFVDDDPALRAPRQPGGGRPNGWMA